MRREEKPTRCHCMLYGIYDTLNMFRALLCPSSGALDYMYIIAAYGVLCLAVGCRGSGTGQPGVRPGRGMLRDCSRCTKFCESHTLMFLNLQLDSCGLRYLVTGSGSTMYVLSWRMRKTSV